LLPPIGIARSRGGRRPRGRNFPWPVGSRTRRAGEAVQGWSWRSASTRAARAAGGRTDARDPWRRPASVDQGETSDRHAAVCGPAQQQVGQGAPLLPLRRVGRSAALHAPAVDSPCRGGPSTLEPGRGRIAPVFWGLQRPSRADRVCPGLAFVSSYATRGQSAPGQVGARPRRGGPLPPMTAAPSLAPTASPPGVWARCAAG
jgi:hypothetical protein